MCPQQKESQTPATTPYSSLGPLLDVDVVEIYIDEVIAPYPERRPADDITTLVNGVEDEGHVQSLYLIPVSSHF